MTIKYSDSFHNSVKKLEDKAVLKDLHATLDKLEKTEDLGDIRDLLVIKDNYEQCRIGVGDYRLLIKEWAKEITILLLEYRGRKLNNYR